ncbi:YebC/PmpR family DNA-binding transcriptional regulator [Feifania hominis]|uniref:Probable transcriptional regulatory protein H8695_06210 n=1 Tax=Feifania hominis TaxID=2763660 RepID=A0A926HV66_9FIRM|nr:YebC/PmpR family DNA-binding transcriptional regulator [Feifania hominis]
MSGHSKWKNIMHKKGKTDAQRAKVFSRIGREISMAVKEGGADPTSNSKLRDLIAKAKQNNVPNENIDRLIKKAQDAGNTENYEDITYEGYGPCGVAVIVETLTDNRNRTAGDMRHYFDKFGGNLGQSGSVSWMFEKKGVIAIEKEGLDADTVMMDALEAGAADFADEADEEVYTVYTDPNELSVVREALERKYTLLSSENEMVPSTYVTVEGDENLKKMGLLLEHLDDNDDVQNVWHNWENEPDEE